MTKTMLCALLAQKDFHQIRRLLVGMNPVDIARLLGELSGSDLPAAFRLLEKEKAAEVFSYMDVQGQESTSRSGMYWMRCSATIPPI